MKKLCILLGLCGLALAATAAPAGRATDGVAVVEKLHATLLEVMQQADTLGYPGRVAKIEPVLAETFDFPTICRIVTGSHWKTVEEAEREAFRDVFARLSAATYAANFDGFKGERFETVSSEERRGNLLVKTVIVKADGERVSLDYVLREADGMWRIVNVIAEGVSDLSLKRADYTAVIKSEGFDSLVSKLNGKIKGYGSGGR